MPFSNDINDVDNEERSRYFLTSRNVIPDKYGRIFSPRIHGVIRVELKKKEEDEEERCNITHDRPERKYNMFINDKLVGGF